MHYYNEFDAKTAAWLRQLILDGMLPKGDVDARSIEDVLPSDLAGYTQCHFFAGIGGWPLALRLVGWPDDQPIWTGSCPCQPFSTAGKGAGFADERHLWPSWQWLIDQCRPGLVFGEQVARGGANAWFDLVCNDLEGMGYSIRAAVLPACSIGAPHIRERLFWMGNADKKQRQHAEPELGLDHGAAARREQAVHEPDGTGARIQNGLRGMGNADKAGSFTRRQAATIARHRNPAEPASGVDGGMGNGKRAGLEIRSQQDDGSRVVRQQGRAIGTSGFEHDGSEWLTGSDGKTRPAQPGILPLAHGVPERVVRISGYGNAIVPHVAAAFIEAVMPTFEAETNYVLF